MTRPIANGANGVYKVIFKFSAMPEHAYKNSSEKTCSDGLKKLSHQNQPTLDIIYLLWKCFRAPKFKSEFEPELPLNSIPEWNRVKVAASIQFNEWNRESLFHSMELNWNGI